MQALAMQKLFSQYDFIFFFKFIPFLKFLKFQKP